MRPALISRFAVDDGLSAPAAVGSVAAVKFVRSTVAHKNVVAGAALDVVIAFDSFETVPARVSDESVRTDTTRGVLHRMDRAQLPSRAGLSEREVYKQGFDPSPAYPVPSVSTAYHVAARAAGETEEKDIISRPAEIVVEPLTIFSVVRATSETHEITTPAAPHLDDIASSTGEELIRVSATVEAVPVSPAPKRVSSGTAAELVLTRKAHDDVVPAQSHNDVVAGRPA